MTPKYYTFQISSKNSTKKEPFRLGDTLLLLVTGH